MQARQLEHLVLVEEFTLVTELVAEVAEQGGGLITNLARAQSRGNLGQRFQLLTDAEPIGCRRRRHAAHPADPGDYRCVAISEVSSGLLGMASLGSEVAFESIDDSAIAL